MKWDQSIFNKNLEFLINVKFNGNQSRFNDKLGRDSATRWKKSRPSLENLLSITKVIYLFVNPKIKHENYCKDVIIRKTREISSRE
jgi:hypothetical protein